MNNFLSKVTGPVIPLPTPFKENHDVDYESLSNYVSFLVDNGIKNVMTTVGTSRFNLLTEDEIKKVNKTVVDAAKGKAVTIVANPLTGGTRHAIEFAKHSEEIGADFFLAYFPERHYGEENTFKFFNEIANAVKIGILIHEMPKRNGMGPGTVHYSIDLLERLLAIDNIVGIKEEALDMEYSNQIVKRFSDKAIIIGAGGGMSRYLKRDYDLGSKAYLGGLGNFVPDLEVEFFKSITSGNRNAAEQIVNEIELPYFEKIVPLGWHPSLKVALSLKGLMPIYERSPMKAMPKSEISIVHDAMKANGWI